MNIVQIPQGEYGYDAALHCPNCGGENLHQTKIEVFDRGEDDYGAHIRTIAGEGQTKIDRDMTMNPSARRNGLRIHFECESGMTESGKKSTCAPVLNIYQHKGTTYVRWDEACNYEELKGVV